MSEIHTRSAEGMLALTALRGVGPATAERLAERFVSLEQLRHATPAELRTLTSTSVSNVLQEPAALYEARTKAERTLNEAARLGVRVYSIFDDDYPNAYRTLADRPPVIYVKGPLPGPNCVACIGTREPSDFGVTVTDRLVEQLVEARWTIVSGLALGVDTLAHEACLRYGGKTVAIMAGGLDSVYPKANAKLASRILDEGGCLISEQPFGIPPSPRNLVQRDRLQSGLSLATFVMQTDIKGGSMHTVKYTLLQDRLLFAPVPQGRHAEEEKSQGILALTQLPAHKLADILDVEGDYRRILIGRFGSRPAAIPLNGRDDYAPMLASLAKRLEEALSSPQPVSAARGQARLI